MATRHFWLATSFFGILAVALAGLSISTVESTEVVNEATGVGENCERGRFTSFASDQSGPADTHWKGPVFHLRQNYPDSPPRVDSPWLQHEFDTTAGPADAERYLRTLLDYGLASSHTLGLSPPPSDPETDWFHVPWQDYGPHGREFVNGLTSELVEAANTLGGIPRTNPNPEQTWSIGLFNSLGGYAVGQVWCKPDSPDLGRLSSRNEAPGFPNGALAIKYLFTTAEPFVIDQLRDSPTLVAHICPASNLACEPEQRTLRTVRLIQVDLAARDDRSPTGWVFGTYRYSHGLHQSQPLRNLLPVGVMWGNSPNGDLDQQWTNPNESFDGWQRFSGHNGLLVGPVDDRASSCMSCHSTAGSPVAPMTPPVSTDPTRWFTNVPHGQPFDRNQRSADYSLQLSAGIENWSEAKALRSKDTTAWWVVACSALVVIAAGTVARSGARRNRTRSQRW